MKKLFAICLIGLAALLTGCASTGTATSTTSTASAATTLTTLEANTGAALQSQLTALCPVVQSQIAIFTAVESSLSSTAQTDLTTASAAVSTICSSSAIASASSLVTFNAVVLPSLIVIGLEYSKLK